MLLARAYHKSKQPSRSYPAPRGHRVRLPDSLLPGNTTSTLRIDLGFGIWRAIFEQFGPESLLLSRFLSFLGALRVAWRPCAWVDTPPLRAMSILRKSRRPTSVQ